MWIDDTHKLRLEHRDVVQYVYRWCDELLLAQSWGPKVDTTEPGGSPSTPESWRKYSRPRTCWKQSNECVVSAPTRAGANHVRGVCKYCKCPPAHAHTHTHAGTHTLSGSTTAKAALLSGRGASLCTCISCTDCIQWHLNFAQKLKHVYRATLVYVQERKAVRCLNISTVCPLLTFCRCTGWPRQYPDWFSDVVERRGLVDPMILTHNVLRQWRRKWNIYRLKLTNCYQL